MNKLKQFIPFIFFFLVTVILIFVYFYNLKTGELIFSGDQLLRFSYYESFANSFFLRKMDNFGVFNSWQQIVQFWDSIYYIIAFKIGLPLVQIEQISFFISLFLSFILTYTGFKKLSLLFKIRQENIILIVLTLWYCINPYTLVMWHGGIYNIGFAITYSLTPLVLYFFDLAVFSNTTIKNKIICAILMFLSSFVFWLFAVVVFVLINYYLLSVFIKKQTFKNPLKHLLILILIFIPLSSFVIFTILHEFLNNANDLNSAFIPTFGNQQGGMWYAMLMLFSWGIYTVWTPRVLFPFGDYFLSSAYKTVTLAIYIMILSGVVAFFIEQHRKEITMLKNIHFFIKDKRNNFLFLFILLLIISIFFAKGSQPPWGGVFLFFYNYVPFFSVFRSADHRFGFAIIICVAVLLLIVSNRYKRYFFFFILLIISIAQSYPMYFGSAVRGENKNVKGTYYDRIIRITPEYQQIADYINKQDKKLGYILPLPSIEYGDYILDIKGNEHHLGQDLLPKIINMPFVYPSVSTGMNTNSAKLLYKAVSDSNFLELQKFPIRYIILRNDISCSDCIFISPKTFALNRLNPVFQNQLFTVYELKDYSPVINGGKLSYQMVNPVKFEVQLANVKNNDELNLALSFNKNWNLYLNKLDGTQSFFDKSIFKNTHQLQNAYANKWLIDTNYIKQKYTTDYYSVNKDGTINVKLAIYYQSQFWYYFYGLISLSIFLSYILFLLLMSKKKKKNL